MIIRVVRRNQGKGRNSGARRISQVAKKKKKKESISIFARLQKEKYSIPGHGRLWSPMNKELHGRAGGGEGDGHLSRRSGEVSPGHSLLSLTWALQGARWRSSWEHSGIPEWRPGCVKVRAGGATSTRGGGPGEPPPAGDVGMGRGGMEEKLQNPAGSEAREPDLLQAERTLRMAGVWRCGCRRKSGRGTWDGLGPGTLCCGACIWTNTSSSNWMQGTYKGLKITACTCSWGTLWTPRYKKTKNPTATSGVSGAKTGFCAWSLTQHHWGGPQID